MTAQVAPTAFDPAATCQLLDCAAVVVGLACNDAALVEFVDEYFHPWFRPAQRAVEVLVTVVSSKSTYVAAQAQFPADAELQPCFAQDQQVMSLPASRSGNTTTVYDKERSCFLRFGPRRVELIGDPSTRRWRFTLIWTLLEIAATRLRQTHVDLHAAAIESAGRALLFPGPKNAGKTTLSFHLMGSRGCRLITNDRCFVSATPPTTVLGSPTAIKIRPPTLARFPGLHDGLPPVARPYLYSSAELETAGPSAEPVDAVEFALTPNQVALRLGTSTSPSAPLGVIVFPRICDEVKTWTLEAMPVAETASAIRANLYGSSGRQRPATLFESLVEGVHFPSHDRITALAHGCRGHLLRLGHGAFADGTLGEQLLRLVTPP
ncbi:MAG: hypothetical protein HY270_22420 [Deltaproteobacteria bacterium]|nr:hypothetical protein [Deltaproteobacteria bacterium]